MLRKLFLVPVSIMLFAFSWHAYYVTITEVELNEESKTFQMTIKFIGHDLEKALAEAGAPELHLGTEKEVKTANDVILKYILKHFTINVNGEVTELNMVGKEVSYDDFIYCYIESEKVKKIKTFSIENDLLVGVFPKQENILHLEVAGKKMSYTFNKEITKHNIELK